MNENWVRDAVAYMEQIRAQMAADVANYEAGRAHTGEFKNGRPLDTTEATVAELKRRIAKTDGLLAAYKAER